MFILYVVLLNKVALKDYIRITYQCNNRLVKVSMYVGQNGQTKTKFCLYGITACGSREENKVKSHVVNTETEITVQAMFS